MSKKTLPILLTVWPFLISASAFLKTVDIWQRRLQFLPKLESVASANLSRSFRANLSETSLDHYRTCHLTIFVWPLTKTKRLASYSWTQLRCQRKILNILSLLYRQTGGWIF